nr:hypothetical protein [Oxalobacteraceae bacterium]
MTLVTLFFTITVGLDILAITAWAMCLGRWFLPITLDIDLGWITEIWQTHPVLLGGVYMPSLAHAPGIVFVADVGIFLAFSECE